MSRRHIEDKLAWFIHSHVNHFGKVVYQMWLYRYDGRRIENYSKSFIQGHLTTRNYS